MKYNQEYKEKNVDSERGMLIILANGHAWCMGLLSSQIMIIMEGSKR